MAGFQFTARLRELFSRYGKVGFAVHCSISAISITGLYVAIKNNVDVEGLLERVDFRFGSRHTDMGVVQDVGREAEGGFGEVAEPSGLSGVQRIVGESAADRKEQSKDLWISGGGALALAMLCNKALLPVRLPLTFAITPPIARFLARRKLYRVVD